MTYDLSNDFHRKQFLARCDNLLAKGSCVELREMTGRSLNQNRYLHLIIGAVAIETGNDLAYTKEMYFKRLVNPDLFVVKKDDRFVGETDVLRSSRDITREDMSTAIDRFKKWAAENGMFLPEPGDTQRLLDIEIEMGRMRNYL